jgi:hypothetical protein
MKNKNKNFFSRGGVDQIDKRPTVTVFIPEEGKEEELPDRRPVASQVLKRERPKVVRSKYQRG